jgi:hypothetical protein
MSDQIPDHLFVLGRRDFLKATLGAAIITTSVATTGRSAGASAATSSTGYGSGRYGAGKYGVTSNRYSIFLPVIRR